MFKNLIRYNEVSGVDILRVQKQQFRLTDTENTSEIVKITSIIYFKINSDNYY